METLRWKTRIAMLWILMAVAISAHSIMVAMDPVPMEKVLAEAGAMGAGMWLFLALFWMLPLWMAFATVSIKGSSNRWLNLVLGIIFVILNIFHFFECGVPLVEGGPLTEPTAHHILAVGSTVVAAALIAWYALKWPKEEA